jgi:predicted small secreted protein
MNRLFGAARRELHRLAPAALLLLPIVIAACNNNGGSGPGY